MARMPEVGHFSGTQGSAGETRHQPASFQRILSAGTGPCRGTLPAWGWKHSAYQKNGRKLVGPLWMQWARLHSQRSDGKAQLSKLRRSLQKRVQQATAKTDGAGSGPGLAGLSKGRETGGLQPRGADHREPGRLPRTREALAGTSPKGKHCPWLFQRGTQN